MSVVDPSRTRARDAKKEQQPLPVHSQLVKGQSVVVTLDHHQLLPAYSSYEISMS